VITAPLRIAFDMDGTLADLSSAYAAVEESLFGVADEEAKHPAPEAREQEQQADVAEAAPETEEVRSTERARAAAHQKDGIAIASGKPSRRRELLVTLKPLEAGAVERLYKAHRRTELGSVLHHPRPATAGRHRPVANPNGW
jgi:phosphoglycolate phosphatase-like HAD superfamily hydrolase